MIEVEKFVESNNFNHWDSPPLSGYIYKNVLEPKLQNALQKEIKQIAETGEKGTFLTNSTIFKFEGQKKKLGKNFFNDRFQNVIFDWTFHPEYWYQTKETIYEWMDNLLITECSPHFVKFFKTMLTLTPFNTKEYVPYRCHINNSPTTKLLGYHLDGSYLLSDKVFWEARTYSVTHYLFDHEENKGGEFFSINGFVYKPKKNTAIAINGNQTLHAVTGNLSENVRLAFTSRWHHIDDLFLPGHPSKHVWKIETDL